MPDTGQLAGQVNGPTEGPLMAIMELPPAIRAFIDTTNSSDTEG